jgi:hypothetical protein
MLEILSLTQASMFEIWWSIITQSKPVLFLLSLKLISLIEEVPLHVKNMQVINHTFDQKRPFLYKNILLLYTKQTLLNMFCEAYGKKLNLGAQKCICAKILLFFSLCRFLPHFNHYVLTWFM